MLFDVTKFYTRGSMRDKEVTVRMKFLSMEKAENWGGRVSLAHNSDFLVIDIVRVSKYTNFSL